MNKGELIDAMASSAKISKADAGRALEAFTESVGKVLKKGDKITLVGFGTFSVTKRAARTGRNPQTGKTIQIKAKKVAKFKAGAELAKVVNK
ncbi:MAG: HU family DNA-binding protein [Bacteroidia bacterium]|nr:HU family DNA-binding protein [Bacteroidia bacterium]